MSKKKPKPPTDWCDVVTCTCGQGGAEVSDSPEETARKRKLLAKLIKLSEEAGMYEDQATPDEIVATIKQIRKEIAQERAKGEHK